MNDAFFLFKSKVVIFIISDFHSFEGIAVVGVFKSKDRIAIAAAVCVELQCHFQCNFDSNTAGAGEKAVIQISGKKAFQFFG